MECDRLEKLIKSWYFQVQDEAMAPARMVAFMKQHISECPFCLIDPLVRQEVDKIAEIVLPPPKEKKPTVSKKKEPSDAEKAVEEKEEKIDSSDAEEAVEEKTDSSDEDPDENDENGDDDDDESEIGVDLEEDY